MAATVQKPRLEKATVPARGAMICLVAFLLCLGGCGGGATSSTTPVSVAAPGAAAPTATPFSHPAELAQVRDAITRSGAQWTADETAVSERVSDLQESDYANSDNEVFPDAKPSLDSRAAASPTRFTWRESGGKDWATPAKDQGKYGTCVAFASVGALEMQTRIAAADSTLAINLSEWCLWCEGTSRQNPDPGGWAENLCAARLAEVGTVTTMVSPYTPEQFLTFEPPPSTATRWRIKSYKWVGGAAAMKAALPSGPLVGSMVVFPDFDNFYTGGIYQHVVTGDARIDSYQKTGTAHAILVIGYDDDQGCWICKNSSGPSWGENGFCRIKYGGINDGGYQYTVEGTP